MLATPLIIPEVNKYYNHKFKIIATPEIIAIIELHLKFIIAPPKYVHIIMFRQTSMKTLNVELPKADSTLVTPTMHTILQTWCGWVLVPKQN